MTKLLGAKIFRKNFISKENMKRYDNMCDMVDKKFKDLISMKAKEIVIYYDEIREVQLGFLNYVQCKLFHFQQVYGLAFEVEDDFINHRYKIKVLESMEEKNVRNNI